MAKQRVNITPDIYKKQPTVMDKMLTPTEEQKPEEDKTETPPPAVQQETQAPKKPAGGRSIKQAAFAIGTEREIKLDELALAYNKQKGTRIGRNDIVRYLIDNAQLEQLLSIDLLEYKK